MKTKNKIFLILAMMMQFAVLMFFTTYSLSIKRSAEKNGSIVKLACTAYDPYHPFKGRYVRVHVVDENPYIKNSVEYYLQENYADKVDRMSNSDFNNLKPEIELYVDAKGRYVQKGMTVLASPEGEERISLEEFLENL